MKNELYIMYKQTFQYLENVIYISYTRYFLFKVEVKYCLMQMSLVANFSFSQSNFRSYAVEEKLNTQSLSYKS